MAKTVDLIALDRQVQRAALERERSERTFEAPESPLEMFRPASGVRTLETLAEVTPSAIEVPVRDALRPWVADLLVARLSYPAGHELARVRREPLVIPPMAATGMTRSKVSWDDAWAELLSSNASGAAAWLGAMADNAAPMAGASREARGRMSEARARVADKLDRFPGELWQKLGWPLPEARTALIAETLLTQTDDLAADVVRESRRRAETRAPSPVDTIVDALARPATSSFPAGVRARWFEELFGRHLGRFGLRIAPVLSTHVFGAASFARALAAFGRALRVAVAAAELPFAIRRTPAGVDAERFAATFGALAASPSFLRHAVDVSPSRARDDQRNMAHALLLEARVRAVRVLLEADESRFEELSTRAFGHPLPNSMRAAWPLPRTGDAARLVGAVTAPDLDAELVERFDEDWFKNPRAFQWIHARGSIPASLTEGAPVDDAAALAAVRRLVLGLQRMLA